MFGHIPMKKLERSCGKQKSTMNMMIWIDMEYAYVFPIFPHIFLLSDWCHVISKKYVGVDWFQPDLHFTAPGHATHCRWAGRRHCQRPRSWILGVTHPKTNSLPHENRPRLKGKDRLPTIIFQGLCVSFREGSSWFQGNLAPLTFYLGSK